MNSLTIIGNLTNDPELRSTTDGKSVCNFNVAVNRRKKQDGTQETDYFRVTVWNGRAENCAKYLAKGKKVSAVGQVSVHAYKDKNGEARATMELLAEDVEFLSPRDVDKQSGYTRVDDVEVPY